MFSIDIFSIIYNLSEYPEKLALKNTCKELMSFFKQEKCSLCNKNIFLPSYFFINNKKCKESIICIYCAAKYLSYTPFSLKILPFDIVLYQNILSCPKGCCKGIHELDSINIIFNYDINLFKQLNNISTAHLICNRCNYIFYNYEDAINHTVKKHPCRINTKKRKRIY